VHYLPLSRSPEVLADAARGVVDRLGCQEAYRDSASGFTVTDYLHHLIETDPSPRRSHDTLGVGQLSSGQADVG
jgi:hypothetical protein